MRAGMIAAEVFNSSLVWVKDGPDPRSAADYDPGPMRPEPVVERSVEDELQLFEVGMSVFKNVKERTN